LQAIEVQIPVFADQVDVVADGRGSMPGFGGRYSPEELAAVVRYTREVL
jgi:mono/diheme cytochrome c family protein